MALDIIFVVCHLLTPDVCKTIRMQTEFTDQQFVQCIYKAEEKIVRYISEKDEEKWFMKSFGCERTSKDS